MNNNIRICCILAAFIFTSAIAHAQPSNAVKTPQWTVSVMFLKGKAFIQCPGQKDMRQLAGGDLITSGCTVVTRENSRLELLLPDGSMVRFSENTSFVIERMSIGEKGVRNIGIAITAGKIWSSIRKALQAGDRFEISCQNAVAGVRGTTYRMDIHEDQSALVSVYDGEVVVSAVLEKKPQIVSSHVAPGPVAGPRPVEGPRPVSMEQWSYVVRSMQRISIAADGQAGEPQSFTEVGDSDSWVKWNKKRDRKQRQ
ncbi:MAG: FecR family protein [Smithellaceae bacterium]